MTHINKQIDNLGVYELLSFVKLFDNSSYFKIIYTYDDYKRAILKLVEFSKTYSKSLDKSDLEYINQKAEELNGKKA